jgi:hypothetical protein
LKGKSISVSIGYFLQSPKEIIGIEDQSKKSAIGNYGKNMKKSTTGAEGMVKTDFLDFVIPGIVGNRNGKGSGFLRIVIK